MKLKEKPKWYEWYICKVWRANYTMNDSKAGRMFALDWGLKTKYVDKPHYCCFSDRDHKAVQAFRKKKKSGKLKTMSVDKFLKELKSHA